MAINLPSLWHFVSDKTPERVLKSIRSLVSLRSIGSKLQYDSEKDSALASYTDEHKSDRSSEPPSPTKRDVYDITVVSEIDFH